MILGGNVRKSNKKVFLIFLLLIKVFLLMGCQELENFNAQLDQEFVSGVMNNLQITKYIEQVVPSGSSIYLQNLDDSENNMWSIFMDSIISDQLVSSNYVLLERNKNNLEMILQERTNESYSVFYEKNKLSNKIEKINLKDIDIKDLMNEDIMSFLEKDRNNVFLVPTHLKPAEYIVSYRILEAHLKYSYHESPWLISFYNNTLGTVASYVNSAVREINHFLNINRTGKLILQLSITNTLTGEIQFAKNIESFYKDTFKGDDRLSYQDFSYYLIAPVKKRSILDKGQNVFSAGYRLQNFNNHLLHLNYDIISNVWLSTFYDQDILNNRSYLGLKYGVPLQASAASAFVPYIGITYGGGIAITYGFDVYYRIFDFIQLGYNIESTNSNFLNNFDKNATIKLILE
jgi:hypothetical protein